MKRLLTSEPDWWASNATACFSSVIAASRGDTPRSSNVGEKVLEIPSWADPGNRWCGDFGDGLSERG
jgi:hypothetical protein